MRNSWKKNLYHWFVCKFYRIQSFRGGWMLTHLFSLDYKYRKVSLFKIAKTHFKGWSYSDWSILGITDENYKKYLSTRDYCSLHPLNEAYSFWIDDKLTLKYILNGTEAGQFMPDYYFILDGNHILPLMDTDDEFKYDGINGLIRLLENKKRLALKLIKSSLGVGFYKAEFDGSAYSLNEEKLTKQKFIERIKYLKGYLVTEYLLPHPEFAKFCDRSVGCLRYVIGRRCNNEIQEIYSFMRFGTKKSKFVENYNSGGVLTIVRNGEYQDGNILDFETNKNIVISKHPDNNIEIKGRIPHWDEVVKAAKIIAETMPQLSYMGIDFCITDDNCVKIIEINSLSSLDCMQIDKSIFDTPGGAFFKERLNS